MGQRLGEMKGRSGPFLAVIFLVLYKLHLPIKKGAIARNSSS